MKVGVIQPNFLPWRGYFDFIREVDLFILYDDVQYTKQNWRNRNRIKTPAGLKWITVPVQHESLDQLIDETPIRQGPWAERIMNQIRDAYRDAPHLEPYASELEALLADPGETIADLDRKTIEWVCGHLGIETPLRSSRAYPAPGTATERLVGMLGAAGATSYLSGPAAKDYLDEGAFSAAGIALEYKTYDYPEYPQLHPPYEPGVSIIDLLVMVGDGAADYL